MSSSSRSALIEEMSVQTTFDELLRDRAPAHVGLMLGKLEVGARDFIVSLVPSPEKGDEEEAGDDDDDDDDDDAGGAKKKKKTRKKTDKHGAGDDLLEVDEDWIVEHSLQVSRMLPGGIAIVGLYAFGSDAAMKAAMPALNRATVEVARAANDAASSASTRSRHDSCDERLILHLSSSTRKYALRRCKIAAGAEGSGGALPSPSPVEHKMGRVMNNLVRVEAKYVVDALISGRNGNGGEGESVREVAERLVESEAERIMAGEVLLGGDLRHAEDQMASVVVGGGGGDASSLSSSSAGAMSAVRAELLCPPRASAVAGSMSSSTSSKPKAAAKDSSDSGRWEARVRGVVSARAYMYNRETAGRAAADLKSDVVSSLRARIQLLIDEADREAEEDAEADEGSGANAKATGGTQRRRRRQHPLTEGAACPSGLLAFALPRRVWARWRDGCDVCDHLAEGERAEDVVERCEEVLDWTVPEGAAGVSDAENHAVVPNAPATAAAAAAAGAGVGRTGIGRDEITAGTRKGGGEGASSSSSTNIRNYAIGAGLAIVTAALSIVVLDELEVYDFY